MATLMQWGNSDGIQGRCDAKCHNAATSHCNCMCGGRYHGGGRDGTLADRVTNYSEEIFEGAAAKAREQGLELQALDCEAALAAIRQAKKWRQHNDATKHKVTELGEVIKYCRELF
jgi:hypothetical protein